MKPSPNDIIHHNEEDPNTPLCYSYTTNKGYQWVNDIVYFFERIISWFISYWIALYVFWVHPSPKIVVDTYTSVTSEENYEPASGYTRGVALRRVISDSEIVE